MDFSKKSDAELNQWIINHERKPGGTEVPLYKQLLEERASRSQAKGQLSIESSMEHLKQAAIQQICTTYGELAKANGADWSKVRRQMTGTKGHLEQLLRYCNDRGLPLLTAICVNQQSVGKGELGEDALLGFVAGARRLGREIGNERDFHHRCREECWQWGREQASRKITTESQVVG